MQSKQLDYSRVSIIDVDLAEPDMFGVFELQFSQFVMLPSKAIGWSSSNVGAKFINLLFWMSKTSLDIFYERDDVDMNEMNWYVLGFNYKETKDSRSLNDRYATDVIEIDRIQIQLNFTMPKLVSERSYDKIIVKVNKEILSEHVTRLAED